MLVVEEKVNDVLSQLPTILGDSPIYAWGDEKHLNKWIELKPNTYPLIYQTSKEEVHNYRTEVVTTKWRAILATQNKNTSLTNDERWALAFRNVLNPLADYIIDGFEQGGFTIVNNSVNIARYGNYGDGNQHFTIDIWDAITFECDLEIQGKTCVGTLNFN